MFGGRVVDEAGDSALAAFPCACEAVLWAGRAMRGRMCCGRRMPGCGVLRSRIGIHAGPVLVYGARVFGRNVVVARRLQQVVAPGETLISASVHDLLPSRAIVRAFRVGEVQLKGISGRVDTYRVDGCEDARAASWQPRGRPFQGSARQRLGQVGAGQPSGSGASWSVRSLVTGRPQRACCRSAKVRRMPPM
jgi:class 3 adenylate cyclase